MLRLLLRWAFLALVIWSLPNVIDDLWVESFSAALMAAAVLSLLNTLVKPILVLLTLPITVLSLGFFLLIINAGLFYWVAALVDGIEVNSFWTSLVTSVFISAFSWISNLGLKKHEGRRRVFVYRDRFSTGPVGRRTQPNIKDVTPK